MPDIDPPAVRAPEPPQWPGEPNPVDLHGPFVAVEIGHGLGRKFRANFRPLPLRRTGPLTD
jgi:hypothetical protein